LIYFVLPSPIGPIGMVSDHGKILRIDLNTSNEPIGEPDTIVTTLAEELNRYFSGNLRHFSTPFSIEGNGFRQKVLRAIQTIPFGETISYRDLAVRSGFPRAVRAVGTVCARNPLPLLIPCHRVIRSDGKIGNYQAGPDRKRILLQIEKNPR
jgi:methylated-DNA-[protein]-cysteine S-methyltransferase